MRQLPLVLLCAALASCGPPSPKPARTAGAGKARAPAAVKPRIVQGTGVDPVPMALVPAGPFLRGSHSGEPDEAPQRSITLSAYYLDLYSVTVAQYRACLAARGCSSEPEAEEYCNWGMKDREDHPVNCVSWFQAEEYCRWAGKRLPTEAEWEKAAAGPTPRRYPWGDREPDCTRAAFMHKTNEYCSQGTVPVASLAEVTSPYGLRQMAGNVFNWVSDWYDKEYYRVSEAQDPRGPTLGKYRVVRGGSCFSQAADLRTTMRGPLPPVMKMNQLGFRCARSAGAAPAAKSHALPRSAPVQGPLLCLPGGPGLHQAGPRADCPLPVGLCRALCQGGE